MGRKSIDGWRSRRIAAAMQPKIPAATRTCRLHLEALEDRRMLSFTPQMLPSTAPPSSPGFTVAGNKVFFLTGHDNSSLHLWMSDGTPGGTDASPYQGVLPQFSSMAEVNGKLFFRASDGASEGIWKTDGTVTGTALVKNIGNSHFLGRGPNNLRNVNGTLFFSATDETHGYELWKSDGTASGTVMVADIRPGTASSSSNPSNLTNVNGTLFFSANDGTHGRELWKSDGTAAGTVMVADVNANGDAIASYSFCNVGGTLFFGANDGTHGYELWKSDGTAGGTALLADINPGTANSLYFGSLRAINTSGTLFFSANDGSHGYELWKSDGTSAGTVLAQGAAPLNTGNPFFSLGNVNGITYFSANRNDHGTDLWKTDGTAAGTTLVRSFQVTRRGYGIGELTNVNGSLFFSGDDGTGPKLWTSDGTTAGTQLVADLSFPEDLTNFRGALLFAAGYNWVLPGLALDLNGAVAGSGYTTSWPGSPVPIVDPTAATIDSTSANLISLTATLANPIPGDLLAADTTDTAISATFNGAALLLTGDDTVAHYQQVLRSITFTTTSGLTPGLVSATVTIVAATANASPFTPVVATIVDIAPAVDANGVGAGIDFAATWFGVPVPVTAADATLVDSDSAQLSSLRVTLSNPQPGDVLAASTVGTNIGSSHASGILLLSGADTVAHYQQVLRTITYNNAIGYPGIPSETASLVTTDSLGAESIVAVTTLITDSPPVIDLNGAGTGINNQAKWYGAAVPIVGASATLTDIGDAGIDIVVAELISGHAGDVLAADTTGTNISTDFDGATLSLSGTDSLEHYQQVLRTISYHNSNGIVSSPVTVVFIAVDTAGVWSDPAQTTIQTLPPSTVAGRHLFYANSPRYDLPGGSNSQTPFAFSDDNAIASDKTALLPGGGAATFANISSYSLGINGVMIDLTGTHGTITAADFTFRVGNNNTLSSWTTPAEIATPIVSVRPGAGAAGSDRVELIWPDHAIQKEWLEVIVHANVNTDLTAADTFFFGSALGDSVSDSASARVDINDELAARNNPMLLGQNVPITSLFDYDRDGKVDITDQLLSRNNQTIGSNVTQFIVIGATSAASPLPNIASALAAVAPASATSTTAGPPAWLLGRLDDLAAADQQLKERQRADYFHALALADAHDSRSALDEADNLAHEFDEVGPFNSL